MEKETVTTEFERFKDRLKEMGVKQFHPYWGPEADKLTQEERMAELNRVLDLIESGDCKEIFDVEYGLEFENREQCREFYIRYPMPTWSENDPESRDTYSKRCDEYEASLDENFKKFMAEKQCNKKT